MIFQKIRIALDGSEHSERAFEFGIQIAKIMNSSVLLFVVHHDAVAPVTSTELTVHMAGTIPDGPSPESTEIANEAAHDYDRRVRSEEEAKAKAENVKVETELVEGDPASEIVKKSRDGFDLIVLGARGRGRLSKLLLGSVSDGVIKNASCPVLIVK
jgi:nucleotide-binding universal stress UspA family protein